MNDVDHREQPDPPVGNPHAEGDEHASLGSPDVELEGVPADQKEREWYRRYYQGDHMPQLTLRAILMGSVLGGVMSLSNLYVGLKTGWALGVAITSCILSYAIWKGLRMALPGWIKTDISILENNCMQSTASSAGYSTGGTMVSAIAAYLIITGHHIAWPVLALWTFFLAVLGVCMAVPLKRQMINVEQLRFPSGIAAAETLKSLHSSGGEATAKARSLGIAGLIGALVAWMRDGASVFWGRLALPGHLAFPGALSGIPLAKFTITFDLSSVLLAAGGIIGWRMCWSMLLGATVLYAGLAPWLVSEGVLNAENLGYREIVAWSTWTGTSIMVTSGLLAFAMQWRTVLRALSGLTSMFGGQQRQEDEMDRIEVPGSWFAAGVAFSGLGIMGVLHFAFGTTWWMGLVAVATTFFLAVVACRATGEADITPVGAMGKITQLTFGVLAPAKMVTNLMTASVTAGAAGSAADLLTDLKSGYLLGANPRKQFIAQFLGIFAGCLVVIPAFYIMVPTASVLGSDAWPAPAAQVWAKVAELLAKGFSALHPTARVGLLSGGLIGLVLPLVEMALPKNYRRFLPSATGLGLAFVIPWFNSFSMFLGGLIALVLAHLQPKTADTYVVPVSSGLIAGESLMGILVILLQKLTGKL
ncbi:MAG: OPT family oligopeptide transporter [Candidatus Eremiobacterota bacterium]